MEPTPIISQEHLDHHRQAFQAYAGKVAADKLTEVLKTALSDQEVPEGLMESPFVKLMLQAGSVALVQQMREDIISPERKEILLNGAIDNLAQDGWKLLNDLMPKSYGPIQPWFQTLRTATIESVEDHDFGKYGYGKGVDLCLKGHEHEVELIEYEGCCATVEFEVTNRERLVGEVAEVVEEIDLDVSGVCAPTKRRILTLHMVSGAIVTLRWDCWEGCGG